MIDLPECILKGGYVTLALLLLDSEVRMPRPHDIAPTYSQVIEKILRGVSAPMRVSELAQNILAERPSTAKDPVKAAEVKIREANGRQLIYLDSKTILPLWVAWQGVRFRTIVSHEEVNEGSLDAGTHLRAYLPSGFDLTNLHLVDQEGQEIEFQIKAIHKEKENLFRPSQRAFYSCYMSDWMHAHKVTPGDHLLFTILDRENGILKIEHEPHKQVNQQLLENRNRLIADILYDLLQNSARERIYLDRALPTAYARLPEKDGYPPYHWMLLIANDERMDTDGWELVYRDEAIIMVDFLSGETSDIKPNRQRKSISKKQKELVYRFKVQLKEDPGIWRVIEVQGKHTLTDLDDTLADAFEDDWDHVSDFWKLVPRGGATRGVARYRKVYVGSVGPFSEGDGAETTIAELELTAGSKLEYVFDSGDRIEHVLTVETIESPQSGVKYPRVAGRNTPQYVNCVECLQKGKETVAIYLCLTCTSKADAAWVVCEACFEKHAMKEHGVEEIPY
jgi:hypothetical protein